jgi:hypothetical protein
MDLTKKTTILLTPDLHKRLAEVARHRKTSIGQLIREACHTTYGGTDTPTRLAAIERLASLSLPVGEPAAMKSESIAPAKFNAS